MTPAAAAARRAVQSRNATEEAILDAAREALAEKGFDSLTMDAIARKAFVSRTAVYFYFPNKRAVASIVSPSNPFSASASRAASRIASSVALRDWTARRAAAAAGVTGRPPARRRCAHASRRAR